MRTVTAHRSFASSAGSFRSLRLAAAVGAIAGSLFLGGCSAAANEAAVSGSGEALSNPTFSFQVHGEGTAGTGADVNLTNAYWLAYTSFEIYAQGGQTEVHQSVDQVPGLDPVTFHWFADAKTDVTAFYIRTPEVAILTFKGTNFDDLKQLEVLADVGLTSFGGGEADSGFVGAFRDMWKEPGESGAGTDSDIRSVILADLAQTSVPLYVTGHSLGGALATLAADAILHDSAFDASNGATRLAAAYTFGSPRVGNATFSDDLATRLAAAHAGFFRVVYDKDPVPGVLPAWPFSHPGKHVSSLFALTADSLTTHEEQYLVWLDSSGAAYVTGDAEVRVQNQWRSTDEVPSLSDHTAYFNALAAHASGG